MESDPCRSFSFSVEEREAAEGAGRKRPARWEEPAGDLAGEESARRLYFSRSRAALLSSQSEGNANFVGFKRVQLKIGTPWWPWRVVDDLQGVTVVFFPLSRQERTTFLFRKVIFVIFCVCLVFPCFLCTKAKRFFSRAWAVFWLTSPHQQAPKQMDP